MHTYPFTKKPAFFPFVSAEVFFEASETNVSNSLSSPVNNEALDHELDKILGLTDSETDTEAVNQAEA